MQLATYVCYTVDILYHLTYAVELVILMLNKNSLAVKKVRGQSEATNISDQKL